MFRSTTGRIFTIRVFIRHINRRADIVAVAALLILGIGLAAPHLWSKVQWSPDGLFYQAQSREIRGESEKEALNTVFSSSLADREKALEGNVPPADRRVASPEWVDYSARFYRRRWTVPLATAGLNPLAGDRAMEDISLIGLVMLGPLLFFLLRPFFPVMSSAVTAGFCVLLPPVLALAPHPGTDYLGLCVLIGCLIALLRIDRGRWISMLVWFALVLSLSFTRDEVIVALTGAAALAWVRHSKRLWTAFGLGIVAYLPSLLFFKVPLQENLAYVIDDYRIPTDTSWGHILREYPSQLGSTLRDDIHYPLETAIPPLTILMGLIAAAGIIFLLRRRRPLDDLVVLARGTLVGAIATILISVNYTQWRLEYVFIPAAAVGIASILTTWVPRLETRFNVRVATDRPKLT